MLKERRCFPVLPALFWKRKDSTSPSRYRANEMGCAKKGPRHAISRAGWWSFLPHQPRLCPFLRSAGVCAASRLLAESCHPSSQPLRLTFGISPQDGYSRGSSRTSFFQAVSPCLLHPSSGPQAQRHPLLSPLPAGPRPSPRRPSPRGAGMPSGQDAGGRRWLRGRDTCHSLCRALVHFAGQGRR